VEESIAIHPILESRRDSRVNQIYGIVPANGTKSTLRDGGEQLQIFRC
jgi:hypothetical protein